MAPPPEYTPSVSLLAARSASETLLALLGELQALNLLLGGPDSHEELLKRSAPLLAFLQSRGALSPSVLASLWPSTLGGHEGAVRVIYQLIQELLPELGAKELHAMWEQVSDVLYRDGRQGLPQADNEADSPVIPVSAAAPALLASSSSSASSPSSLSFTLTDFYLTFLARFTVGAVKRLSALWDARSGWEQEQAALEAKAAGAQAAVEAAAAAAEAHAQSGVSSPLLDGDTLAAAAAAASAWRATDQLRGPDAGVRPPEDWFNRSTLKGSAPVFAVKCFTDLLRNSRGSASGHRGGDGGKNVAFVLSPELQGLVASQLLPDCLAAFPKEAVLRHPSPEVADSKDASAVVVLDSNLGVAAGVLRDCIAELHAAAAASAANYDFAAVSQSLRLMEGIISFFPWAPPQPMLMQGPFAAAVAPPAGSSVAQSRQTFVREVLRSEEGGALQHPVEELMLPLLRAHARAVRAVKKATPSAVQSNGDVVLPSRIVSGSGGSSASSSSSLSHSTLLRELLDTFALVLVCDPRGDFARFEAVEPLWRLLVGPLPYETETEKGRGEEEGPVSVLDACHGFHFLWRLVDLDALKHWDVCTRAQSVAASASFGSSSLPPSYSEAKAAREARSRDRAEDGNNLLGLRCPAAVLAMCDDDLADPRGADSDDEVDAAAATEAGLKKESFGFSSGSDDEEASATPLCESDMELEDFDADDADATGDGKVIPGMHFSVRSVRLLLTRLLFRSFEVFHTPLMNVRQLGAGSRYSSPPTSSVAAPTELYTSFGTSGRGQEPVQLLLLRHAFFLANQREPLRKGVGASAGETNAVHMGFAPFVALKRTDGKLLGMDGLWQVCMGGWGATDKTDKTATTVSPASSASSAAPAALARTTSLPSAPAPGPVWLAHVPAALLKELHTLLLELYSTKFLPNGAMMVSSLSGSTSQALETKAQLGRACVEQGWKHVRRVVAALEREPSSRALAGQLLQSLQLLQEHFDSEARGLAFVAPKLSAASPFHTITAASSSAAASATNGKSALDWFADKYYAQLRQLLTKFTSESAAAASASASGSSPSKVAGGQGGVRLGGTLRGPITDMLFKLLLRLPQRGGGADGGLGLMERLRDFNFGPASTSSSSSSSESSAAAEVAPKWEEVFSSSSRMSLLFSLQLALELVRRKCPPSVDLAVHLVEQASWKERFVQLGGLRHCVQLLGGMKIDRMGVGATTQAGEDDAAAVNGVATGLHSTTGSGEEDSDMVLSTRCLNALLDFLSTFFLEANMDTSAAKVLYSDLGVPDLPAYAAQLRGIIEGVVALRCTATGAGAATSATPSPPPPATGGSGSFASASFPTSVIGSANGVSGNGAGAGSSGSIGYLTPSPPPSSATSTGGFEGFRSASSLLASTTSSSSASASAPSASASTSASASAGKKVPQADLDLLASALALYAAMVIWNAAAVLPVQLGEAMLPGARISGAKGAAGSATGAVVSVVLDEALLPRSFLRRLLVEGILLQADSAVRRLVGQALDEQFLEVWEEHVLASRHPRPLRWAFIGVLAEVLLDEELDASVDWGVMHPEGSGLHALLELATMVLHKEVEPFEPSSASAASAAAAGVFKVVHADIRFPRRKGGEMVPFNPLVLASSLLGRLVSRPALEGALHGQLQSSDNTHFDRVLVGLANLVKECVEMVRYQGRAEWTARCGAHTGDIQREVGENWMKPLWDMLYALPEPPQADASASSLLSAQQQNPPPKAKSFQARESLSSLLKSLCHRSWTNLRLLVSWLAELQDVVHLKGDARRHMKEWEFKLPSASSTSGDDATSMALAALGGAMSPTAPVPYLGIKNLGNTCYINALIQQLYMIPSLRRDLTRIRLGADGAQPFDRKASVVAQLQEILVALSTGAMSKNPASTEGFCRSFKDWDGVSINPAVQEDSGLFFTRLVDKVNEELKGTPYAGVLRRTLCGTLCTQLLGTGEPCRHSKASPEEFTVLALDVKNKRDLRASLDAFIQGELLAGGNAYMCSLCGSKVSTLRRTVVSSLPPTLVLMLKRFEMDYNTYQSTKINERLEFPTTIDMFPYTLEGVQAKEAAQKQGQGQQGAGADGGASSASSAAAGGGASNGAAASASAPLHPPEYYQYVLRGVVVHSGTAAGGHYYSYIQDRSVAPSSSSSSSSGWFEFNDKRITPFDFARDIAEEAFGGGGSDVWGSRSRSGYILFYDRVRSEVKLTEAAEAGESKKVSFASAARAVAFVKRVMRRHHATQARLYSSSALAGSDSALDASASSSRSSHAAMLAKSYASLVGAMVDQMVFHGTSGLGFHYELFRDCLLGTRFVTEDSWKTAAEAEVQSSNAAVVPVSPSSVLPLAQHALRHFLHVFLRSFTHDKLLQPWVHLLKNLFTPPVAGDAKPFAWDTLAPVAEWFIEYCCYVKPEPAKPKAAAKESKEGEEAKQDSTVSGDASTTASSSSTSSTAATSSASSSSKPAKSSTSTSSSSTSVVRPRDDFLTGSTASTSTGAGPKSGTLKKARRNSFDDSSVGGSLSWDDDTDAGGVGSGDSGGGYEQTLPPFDAPPSIVFTYLFSCPEQDVRDAMAEVLASMAVMLLKYSSAKREASLPPAVARLVDHLCQCVPFLPYYARHALSTFLKLVVRLAQANVLVIHRFLSPSPSPLPLAADDPSSVADGAVSGASAAASVVLPRNDLLARLIDLLLGGVKVSEDNPTGNRVNGMALTASGAARKYYPLTKNTLSLSSSSTTQHWHRYFWQVLDLLATHADVEPLKIVAAAGAAAEAVSGEAGAKAAAGDVAGSQAVQSTSDAVEPIVLSRRGSADSTSSCESVVLPPAPALSPDSCLLLCCPPFLSALISDSSTLLRLGSLSSLVARLAAENIPWSSRLSQAVFALLEKEGNTVYSYTMLRLLLRQEDFSTGERRVAVLKQWLRFLEQEQMYWTVLDGSLDALLTLLTRDNALAQSLVELMHSHVDEWKWVRDWLLNNRWAPSLLEPNESGVALDKPGRYYSTPMSTTSSSGSKTYNTRSSSRANKSASSSAGGLQDAWKSGSTWRAPSFNVGSTSSSSTNSGGVSSWKDQMAELDAKLPPLGLDEPDPSGGEEEEQLEEEKEKGQGSGPSAAAMLGVEDEEDSEEGEAAGSAKQSSSTNAASSPSRRAVASSSAVASAAPPRAQRLQPMKVVHYSPREKFFLLSRLWRGLAPDDGKEDADVVAQAGPPADWEAPDAWANTFRSTAGSGSSGSSRSSGSKTLSFNNRAGISNHVRHTVSLTSVGGSASGDEEDPFDFYDEESGGSGGGGGTARSAVPLGGDKGGSDGGDAASASSFDASIYRVGLQVDALCECVVGQPRAWQAATIIALNHAERKAKVHWQQHYFAAPDVWIPLSDKKIAPRGTRMASMHSHYN